MVASACEASALYHCAACSVFFSSLRDAHDAQSMPHRPHAECSAAAWGMTCLANQVAIQDMANASLWYQAQQATQHT